MIHGALNRGSMPLMPFPEEVGRFWAIPVGPQSLNDHAGRGTGALERRHPVMQLLRQFRNSIDVHP